MPFLLSRFYFYSGNKHTCSLYSGTIFKERGIIMKKVMRDISFFGNLLIMICEFLGVVGMAGLLFGIAYFLK